MSILYYAQQLYTTVKEIAQANAVCVPLLLLAGRDPAQGDVLVVDGPLDPPRRAQSLSRLHQCWATQQGPGQSLIAAGLVYGCKLDGQVQPPSLRQSPAYLKIQCRTATEAACFRSLCRVSDFQDLDFEPPESTECPPENDPFFGWEFAAGASVFNFPGVVRLVSDTGAH